MGVHLVVMVMHVPFVLLLVVIYPLLMSRVLLRRILVLLPVLLQPPRKKLSVPTVLRIPVPLLALLLELGTILMSVPPVLLLRVHPVYHVLQPPTVQLPFVWMVTLKMLMMHVLSVPQLQMQLLSHVNLLPTVNLLPVMTGLISYPLSTGLNLVVPVTQLQTLPSHVPGQEIHNSHLVMINLS